MYIAKGVEVFRTFTDERPDVLICTAISGHAAEYIVKALEWLLLKEVMEKW